MKNGETSISFCGPSSPARNCSPDGLPIVNFPPGTATIRIAAEVPGTVSVKFSKEVTSARVV